MSTLEEISAWSNDELEAEVRQLLPSDWVFNTDQVDGWWVGSISNGALSVWADRQVDRRMLLLNAFGWLLVRDQQPSDPQWRRRRELSTQAVVGSLGLRGVEVPDPEDLDPREVRAVYGGQLAKKEK